MKNQSMSQSRIGIHRCWTYFATWVFAISLSVLCSKAFANFEGPQVLEFEFGGVNEKEREIADEINSLLEGFDLEPWLFTRKVRVKSGVIPHSHPVLTLNTRHIDDRDQLLATFLHEQIHWYLAGSATEGRVASALEGLPELYPEVPGASDGGASTTESTYLHLIVNWLEYDALETLLGREKAREIIEDKTYYQWIYTRVLTDFDQLKSVVNRYGLKIED